MQREMEVSMKLKHIFIFILAIQCMASLTGMKPDANQNIIHEKENKKRTLSESGLQASSNALEPLRSKSCTQHLEESLKNVRTTFSLTAIIEAHLASNDQEEQARELLNYLNNPATYHTQNPTRHALAQKWIRNATSRISPDETRFLTEIITNACDACLDPLHAIGKRGLGFFSIFNTLAWNATIEVKTSYYDINGQLQNYSMLFEKVENGNKEQSINVTFNYTQNTNCTGTGTTVCIKPALGNLISDSFLSKLTISSCKSLRFYTHVPIILKTEDVYGLEKSNFLINIGLSNNSNQAPIQVSLSPHKITVHDSGRGMPLWTALQDLLIPSQSLKNPPIKKIDSIIPIPKRAQALHHSSHFFMTANGVTIICKKLPIPLFNDQNQLQDLFIELPKWTSTTLALNEITISNDGLSDEEVFIKKMILATIQEVISGKNKDNQVLYALYQALDVWEKESSSTHIKGKFSKYLQDQLNQALKSERTFAAPLEFVPLYNKLFKHANDGITIIPVHPALVYNNYEPLEEHLMKLGRERLATPSRNPLKLLKQRGAAGELIFGLYVFCASNLTQASHLGLRTCIFIPESIFTEAKSEAELINRLLCSLPERRYQATAEIKSSRMQTLTAEQQQIFNSFCSQYHLLFEQFKLSPGTLSGSNQFAYSWTENVTAPLTSLVPNRQAITTRLMQDSLSFNMFQLILTTLNISPEIHQEIQSLHGTHLGGYRNLFNFGPQSLPYTYGAGDTKISCTFNGVTTHYCGMIAPLICMLDPEEKIYLHNIMQLQKKDFLEKISSSNRDRLLSSYQLHIPSSLGGTPLFFLGALAAKTNYNAQARELIKTIIDTVKGPEELAFITTTLINLPETLFKHVLTPAGLETLKSVIHYYIQEKIEPITIKKFYAKLQLINHEKIQNILSFAAQEQASKSIERIFEKLMQGQADILESFSTLPPELTKQENKIPQEKTFLLSQLFETHCQNNNFSEALDQQDIETIIKQIQSSPRKELKKIEQCSEAGSERNYIDATVIEALQNSIDASREFYNNLNILTDAQTDKLATIDIRLERQQTNIKDHEAIKLTIHDNAGFPSLRTLLTNFILPDLSEKSAAAGAIGEMGNGSFKMYQKAQVVHVLTRTTKNPNLCYLLKIEPVRSQGSELVKDLALTCSDVSSLIQPDFHGTSITITLQEESSVATEMTLASTIDFLHNYIGSTTAHLTDGIPFKIMLHTNNESIELNKDSSKEILDTFVNCNSKPIIRVFKRAQQYLSSFITTAGIPFCPLDIFATEQNLLPPSFIKQLGNGYIIDFAPGTYEPVQSRTKLQLMIPRNKIREIFLDIFYAQGLEKAINEQILLEQGNKSSDESFLKNNFTHFFSRCSLFQLTPSIKDQEIFDTALSLFLKNGIWQSNILESKFFDFYRNTNHSSMSFGEYLQEIHKELLNADEKYFQTIQCNLYAEYLADINSLFSLPTTNEKIAALAGLKTKFQDNITRNLASIDQARALSRREVINTWGQQKISQITRPDSALNGIHQGLFKTIVMSWISRKMNPHNYFYHPEVLAQVFIDNLTAKVIPSHLQQSQQDSPSIQTDSVEANKLIALLDCVNTLFCSEYLSLSVPQLINNGSKPISCFFSNNLKKNTLGFYQQNKNQITLNHENTNFIDMITLLEKIRYFDSEKNLISEIQNHSAFQTMYQPTLGKVPVLIHELEHARRYHLLNQDPGKGGCEKHDDGYDIDNNCLKFDACAQSWAEYAFKKGLILNWIKKVQNILRQDPELTFIIINITKKSDDDQTKQIIATLTNITSTQAHINGSQTNKTIAPRVIPSIVLEDAPIFKSLKKLKAFLAQGNDINKQYPIIKLTILHKAVTEQLPAYIEELLKEKANPNLQDADGDTPLHKLFKTPYRKSSKEIAELLIAYKASLEITNHKGDTPFHIAATQTSGLYTHLLKLLQNVNIQNAQTGQTLLHMISALASDKSDRALYLLLERQADVTIADAQGNLPLHYAVQNKDIDIIKKLLDANKDVTINAKNKIGKTPLFFAIQSNNIEIIDFLIQQGADPNIVDYQGNNMLHHAFSYKLTITASVIKHLINKINNNFVNTPNHNGELPAHIISPYEVEGTFKLIMNKTKNLNAQDKYGDTALHNLLKKPIANNNKHYKNLSYLANLLNRKNLPLNVRNCYGITPQHYALENNYPEKYLNIFTSKELLALPEEFHNTPLHWAAENGCSDYVCAHIESGQYQVDSTRDGLSPLHLAAYHGHLDTVKTLIGLQANINLTDSWGQTALHWALLGNHQNVIDYLLEQGANPDAQDHLGRKPDLEGKNLKSSEKLAKFSLNRNN